MRRTNVLLMSGLIALWPSPAQWWPVAVGGALFIAGVVSLMVDASSAGTGPEGSIEQVPADRHPIS